MYENRVMDKVSHHCLVGMVRVGWSGFSLVFSLQGSGHCRDEASLCDIMAQHYDVTLITCYDPYIFKGAQ